MKPLIIQLVTLAAITWTIGEIYIYNYKKKHSPLNKKS